MDGRYIEPFPERFKQLFITAAFFSKAIEETNTPVLLLIDTYEKLKPQDDWLRMDFLPELPGNVMTVIAGRSSLTTNWKTDSGWQSIAKMISLKELTDEQSIQLLNRRNIPEEQVKRIVDYTHGNALALSVVADIFDRQSID